MYLWLLFFVTESKLSPDLLLFYVQVQQESKAVINPQNPIFKFIGFFVGGIVGSSVFFFLAINFILCVLQVSCTSEQRVPKTTEN